MPVKLLRTPTAGRRHHLLVLHLLLLLLSRSASASTSTEVTHLPGFDGPLPFYLETGYVVVEEETGTELFYYFAESERSPGTDPVILWLTGGPRCSAFSGFAFQVGPVKYVLAPYTGGLPQLVHIHSPICSGFSFACDPKGCDVGDYSSSLQVQRFLNKGYLIGNPITDPKFDKNFLVQGAHGFGIISDQIYEAAMKNCNGNYVNPGNQLCVEVLETVNSLISEIPDAHVLYKKCVARHAKAHR